MPPKSFDPQVIRYRRAAKVFGSLIAVFSMTIPFHIALAQTPLTAAATASTTPPAALLGNFDDDYGGHFSISASQFIQLPRGRFNIVQWNVAEQYFVAQNDSLNRSEPNKWTRIDWVTLPDMAPYTWAFCFSAYKATTRAEAESTHTARRESPKTGCGGFPFTRMKASQLH